MPNQKGEKRDVLFGHGIALEDFQKRLTCFKMFMVLHPFYNKSVLINCLNNL